MAKGEFIKKVKVSCMEALVDLGLKNRGSGIAMTEPSPEGIAGWIGLGTATRYSSTEMEVLPMLGVRWDAVQRLESELYESKYHRSHPPTISVPLYTLMPQKKPGQFVFKTSASPALGARKLAKAVELYALPFFEKHSKMKRLLARIPRDNMWEDGVERFLCAHYLLDPRCDLEALTKSRVARAPKGVDVAQVEEFSRRLQARQAG